LTTYLRGSEGTIELGLRGERVSLGDHIAYFWEKPNEFEEAEKPGEP